MKKVTLTLTGLNGNAFALMGAFQHAARKQGWNKAEIQEVLDKCTSGDYNNLLVTLMDNCEDAED